MAGGLTGNLQPLWAKASQTAEPLKTMQQYGCILGRGGGERTNYNGYIPCESNLPTLCNKRGGVRKK